LWDFWYFGQTLIDNHKPVMISISYLKHDKNVILFFLGNMHKKPLGFSCMHENKTSFFCFLKIKLLKLFIK
jgi:hypothetical protein